MEREVLKNKYSNAIFPVKRVRTKKITEAKERSSKIIKEFNNIDYSEMTVEEIKSNMREMWVRLGEPMAEDELQERASAMRGFYDMRAIIAAKNLPELTLDEINEEIAEMRAEMKVEKTKGGL